MRCLLTEEELDFLGWNDPELLDRCPRLYNILLKCDGETELSSDDIDTLLFEFDNLNLFGGEGYYTVITQGLLRIEFR